MRCIPEDITAQLRDMEGKGLLTRKVYAEVPPCAEYSLTETGYDVKSVLGCLFRKKAAKQDESGEGKQWNISKDAVGAI